MSASDVVAAEVAATSLGTEGCDEGGVPLDDGSTKIMSSSSTVSSSSSTADITTTTTVVSVAATATTVTTGPATATTTSADKASMLLLQRMPSEEKKETSLLEAVGAVAAIEQQHEVEEEMKVHRDDDDYVADDSMPILPPDLVRHSLPAMPSPEHMPSMKRVDDCTPTVTPEALRFGGGEETKNGEEEVQPVAAAAAADAAPSSPPPAPPTLDVVHSPPSVFRNSPAGEKPSNLTVDTTKSEISELGETSPSGAAAGGFALGGVTAAPAAAASTAPGSSSSSTTKPSSSRRYNYDDDDDSSNDESSYFADPSNLPSPKSGRNSFVANQHFDYDTGATPTNRSRADSYGNRESDASLSLSEDSDDGHHVRQNHHQQQPRSGGVPELYPHHRITRIHSVSSLVSTSSQYSSDDPNVQDELRIAAEQDHPLHGGSTPSGRKSPVLGQHPPSRNSSNPMMIHFGNPLPSPPPILSPQQQQYYALQQQQEYPHPQPHIMTQEEIAQWTAQGYTFPPYYYGAPPLHNSNESPLSKEGSALSKESNLTYSEDSETAPLMSKGKHQEVADNGSHNSNTNRRTVNQSGAAAAGGSRSRVDGAGVSSSSGHAGHVSRRELSSREGGDVLSAQKASARNSGSGGDVANKNSGRDERGNFKVYWQRWIMLMYMSILNLLSDWTCYSVAPIAILTQQAFGRINPEQLVVVFLCANGIATACEPILLSRLGLRRTVLFGALLLMMGSIVKSGGMPPIIQADLQKGHGEWRVYLGFFLVGLSQPLYQCTPALLSASWFPERERTLATGVALNANQLGIGFAFIFGTLLVSTSDDIPGYFGLLSLLSTLVFIGTLIQFDDAPPTPPSETARAVRGTLEVGLPSIRSIFDSVRNLGSSAGRDGGIFSSVGNDVSASRPNPETKNRSRDSSSGRKSSSSKREGRKSRKKDQSSSRRSKNGNVKRRSSRTNSQSGGSGGGTGGSNEDFHGLAPSPALYGSVADIANDTQSSASLPYDRILAFPAPSPMMPGPVGPPSVASSTANEDRESESSQQDQDTQASQAEDDHAYVQQPGYGMYNPYPFYPPVQQPPAGFHSVVPPEYNPQQQPMGMPYGSGDTAAGGVPYGYGYGYPPPYQQPVWDPRFQQYVYLAGPSLPHPQQHALQNPYYMSYQNPPPPAYMREYESADNVLPPEEERDFGAEPVLTITPHHLDINIRDDQVLRSLRACFAREGFIHALVSFTVSGIVINTLSTYMDFLGKYQRSISTQFISEEQIVTYAVLLYIRCNTVRLNGAGREYTGIVGGSFQFVIMISSLIVGQFTDRSRAYYSITVGMLVLGAFALAECGVNLDSDKGPALRWSLVITAALVGPLQPVSTELGVDVVYPLSENTVLVVQQLFSNLLSAGFIPIFKAFKDVGIRVADSTKEQPEYTFSFYVLIVLQ